MGKIKNYLMGNKKEVLFLLFVVVFALLLRIVGALHHGDLWTDELFSLYYAEKSSVFELLKTMFNEDLHAPFYPIFLHFWIKFFSSSVFLLRFSSIILGVIFFPAVFYVAKNFFNNKTAYFSVLLLLFSAFCIHNSLELRPYALLPLLSVLSSFYYVKFLIDFKKSDIILFLIFDLLLLYTFNIAFIFAFFQFFCGFIYIFCNKKDKISPFLKSFGVFSVLYIPCAVMNLRGIFLYKNATASLADNMFPFYPSFIFRVLETFFSSQFLHLRSNYSFNFNQFLNPTWYFVSVLPILICLSGLFKALKQKDITLYLFFLPAFLFLLTEIILAFNGSLILLLRYTLIAFPIFLISAVWGLSLFEKKKIGLILLLGLLFVNSFSFFFISKANILFLNYEDTSGILEKLFKQEKIKDSDFVLFPFYKQLYQRYVKTGSVVDFSANSLFFPKDEKIMEIFYGKQIISEINQKNAKEILKPYFENPMPNKSVEKYFNDLIFSKMQSGDRLFVIVDSAGVIETHLKSALNPNSLNFKKANLSNLIYVRAEKDILELCEKYLRQKKLLIFKRKATKYTRVQIYEKI